MMSEIVTYVFKLPKWSLSDEEAMGLLSRLVTPADRVYVNDVPYYCTVDTRLDDNDVVIVVVRKTVEHREVFKKWNLHLELEWKRIVNEYNKHVEYIQLYNTTHGGCTCQKS